MLWNFYMTFEVKGGNRKEGRRILPKSRWNFDYNTRYVVTHNITSYIMYDEYLDKKYFLEMKLRIL